jgi:hypothetical protein
MWVSWKNQHTDFSQPPKFEEKVAIFNAGQEKGSEAIYLLAYDPLSRVTPFPGRWNSGWGWTNGACWRKLWLIGCEDSC